MDTEIPLCKDKWIQKYKRYMYRRKDGYRNKRIDESRYDIFRRQIGTEIHVHKDKWIQRYLYTRINGYRDAFI